MSATVDTHSCLSLVVLITWRVLLFCAEHLFGAVSVAVRSLGGGTAGPLGQHFPVAALCPDDRFARVNAGWSPP
jgi:hypothetical protein